MDTVYSIIAFVIIFCIVVVSHEFGHFIVAKINGIKVVEFSVGMGPKIFKIKKGETTYSLRLLPLGGACVFEDEDALYEEDEEHKKQLDENPLESETAATPGSFRNSPVWVRILTVVAGPVFNIILGYLLAMIIIVFCGSSTTKITEVVEGFPAYEAGLEAGDVITEINGENVHIFQEISLIAMLDGGKEWELEYERDGQRYNTTLTPVLNGNSYVIGIKGGDMVEGKGLDLFEYSWYEVQFWLKTTIKSLQKMVQGQVSKDDIAGPVGVVQVIGDTIEQTQEYGIGTVLLNLVNIALLLSVNLGVMNLLPVPALDGGRLVLLLVEAVIRKPVPQKLEMIITVAGFIFLMLVTVLVLFNDISRFFR